MDQVRRTPTAKSTVSAQNGSNNNVRAKKKTTRNVSISIIMFIIIIAAVTATIFFVSKKDKETNLAGIKTDQYQALFLTNGQVYFGKVEQADSKTIKISDIYYLQVQQTVQPKDEKESQGETQLIKLGDELHGPEDEMYIDRGQVLFWENLKNNGKVAEAIKEYKKR